MAEKTVCDIGSILDSGGSELLRMWSVDVPHGKRPLWNHHHMSFEITVVNSGRGVYTTNRAAYPMSCGDMFVFSGNESHCITEVSSDSLSITNLHFEPRYLWKNTFDDPSMMNINFCFSHSKSFENHIDAEKTKDLPYFMRRIEDELREKDEEYAVSVKSLLNLMLVSLIRDFGYADKNNESGMNREQIQSIQHILSYIDEHFAEKLTLEQLSELAGLTPNYFSALFKKVSGITLWKYINSKRIDKAIQIITDENSKINIIDAAAECGFNNTANFNKTFKSITGMTPSEYRNNKHLIVS